MRRKRIIRNRHCVLVLSVILITILKGSWREIPKYYKNMVYVSLINALYYLLCRRHLVWEFIPNGVNWLAIRIVHTVIVTPLIVLVFLSKMPNTLFKQFIYFVRWFTISSAVEYFIHKKHLILYAHGWNVFWSGILYVKMFLYSHLFTKRPILSLFLSLCSTVYFIFKFKVPLKIMHFSRFFQPLVDLYYHTFLDELFTRKKFL
ncbi:CBO0543 family protein [Neobacillus mesonae]|uniref:CBO0543 family protein n=1 Tax=Neobacillus mesonae TaxID=1193713 RepID=UPI000830A5CA